MNEDQFKIIKNMQARSVQAYKIAKVFNLPVERVRKVYGAATWKEYVTLDEGRDLMERIFGT